MEARCRDAVDILSESIALSNTKRLWGKTPALDILNLEANEGLDYKKELHLKFDGMWLNYFTSMLLLTKFRSRGSSPSDGKPALCPRIL